jgi:GntR family transcriptional regulator
MRNRIAPESSVPAYRQIADWIRSLLLTGEFQPRDTLPSVRQMAKDVGVNFNTVAQAYRLLEDEGWLELQPGRRAVVLQRPTPEADPETVIQFGTRLRGLVALMRASGVSLETVRAELQAIANELNS